MKNLLALCVVPLACLHVASADDTRAAPTSIAMLCTQEGIGKGYKGKDLEDFVAKCVKARQSSGEDDPVIKAAMSGC
jgi:hypothetical protein